MLSAYSCDMDTAVTWTIVGSAAAVASVLVALGIGVLQLRQNAHGSVRLSPSRNAVHGSLRDLVAGWYWHVELGPCRSSCGSARALTMYQGVLERALPARADVVDGRTQHETPSQPGHPQPSDP